MCRECISPILGAGIPGSQRGARNPEGGPLHPHLEAEEGREGAPDRMGPSQDIPSQ